MTTDKIRGGGENPDDRVRDYEDDEGQRRQARMDEADDIALAAPGGIAFDSGEDTESHFDAEHNP